jgi:hypothetical protein
MWCNNTKTFNSNILYVDFTRKAINRNKLPKNPICLPLIEALYKTSVLND